MLRGAGVWVLRDGERVKQQFGGTLWKKSAQSKHLTLAWSRCFVTGRPGNSSEIQMHHEHVNCLDILVAPCHLKANKLLAGLCAADGDEPLTPAYRRLGRLRDLCWAMDGLMEDPSTTSYASIEATGHAGNNALQLALAPGGELSHLVTSRVSSDLRNKAGLKPGDKAYMFKSAALESMPFVSRKTVFVLEEKEKWHQKFYLRLVYGQCSITGVGGKKTNKSHWPVVLHHITHRKRHYLVGFILDQINTGLGALGNYPSK